MRSHSGVLRARCLAVIIPVLEMDLLGPLERPCEKCGGPIQPVDAYTVVVSGQSYIYHYYHVPDGAVISSMGLVTAKRDTPPHYTTRRR